MSGSEMEERKQKRKLSNRESARRSRMRKQQHLQDLANQVALLMKDNAEMVAQVEALTQHHQRLEAENGDLRVQAARLKRRLQSLSAVPRLAVAGDLGGVAVDAQGCCSAAGRLSLLEIRHPNTPTHDRPHQAFPLMEDGSRKE